ARRVTEPLRRINARLPESVTVGYHSCFGTLSGWPSRTPSSLRGSVILLNQAIVNSGRAAAYVHFPTLGSDDDAFFAPLSDLNVGGARVYVGAIHHMHGTGGIASQLNVVRRYLENFGLAAPCGFGRAPERPGRLLSDQGAEPPRDLIEAIVADHRASAE